MSFSEFGGLRVYIRTTYCSWLPERGGNSGSFTAACPFCTWHLKDDFSTFYLFFASFRIGKSHRTQTQEGFLLSPWHLCPARSLQKSRVMNRLAAPCAHSFFGYSVIAASTQSGARKSKEILEPSPGPESDTSVPPWVLAEPWRLVTRQG